MHPVHVIGIHHPFMALILVAESDADQPSRRIQDRAAGEARTGIAGKGEIGRRGASGTGLDGAHRPVRDA